MKGLGGTPGFMAPEIEKYVGKELYTDKVDSFSFGMYIYELVTLHQPFNDLNPAQVKQLIVEGHRPPLTTKVFNHLSLLEQFLILNLESNPKLLQFCFISWCDCSRKLAQLFQPIRTKTKRNRDLVIRVFPRFRQFACFYFEFSLAHGDIFFAMIGYSGLFGFGSRLG